MQYSTCCSRIRPSLAILSLAWLASGCGSGLDLHPVNGRVEYPDGSPVTGGTVVCTLIDSTPRRSANGDIQPDGSFQLGTLKANDGVVSGTYSAAVLPPALSEAEASRTRMPIALKFQDPSTSELEFEIKPGKNDIVLQVTRP